MDITSRDILIWLNSIGMGNSNIDKIMKYFHDLRELWEASNREIYSIKELRKPAKEKIVKNRNKDTLKTLLNKIKESNISIITIFDENYPNRLKYIDDKPNVLYTKGETIKENLSIAIVGSRKATAYGAWACEKFTKELTDMNITIISGMAAGIDTTAHKTALKNNGKTIGILGNGIDIVYPKSNQRLYSEMVKNNSLISEFPFATPPLAYNFPQRNRIISGMSMGVIVIEAKEKSGSLITAHHALDQGKDVFALPGNINSVFSGGTNRLIKDGAKPLLDIEDIIEEIYELKERQTLVRKRKLDYSNYSETEVKIIKALELEPAHIDKIAYTLNIDISKLNSILTILELKGTIKEISNNIFTID